jgi:hypothetical protein
MQRLPSFDRRTGSPGDLPKAITEYPPDVAG